MALKPFVYQDPLPLSADTTEYRLLSSEGVSTTPFEGREILKVDPQALAYLAETAFRESAFRLRTSQRTGINPPSSERTRWPGRSCSTGTSPNSVAMRVPVQKHARISVPPP